MSRISESAQLLKNPDQRQTFTRRSAVVLIKESLEPIPPGANPWQRLLRALAMKLGRIRPDDLRTTFRETRSSRQISLIASLAKNRPGVSYTKTR
jgi:hypothetical protein